MKKAILLAAMICSSMLLTSCGSTPQQIENTVEEVKENNGEIDAGEVKKAEPAEKAQEAEPAEPAETAQKPEPAQAATPAETPKATEPAQKATPAETPKQAEPAQKATPAQVEPAQPALQAQPAEQAEVQAAEPAQEATPAQPAEPAKDAKQIAASYIGQSASSLQGAIGSPSSTDYSSSCLGDGEDGEWRYNGFTVYTYRENGSETITDVQ